MKKIIFLLIVLLPLSSFSQSTKNLLPPKYKKWLEEEVVYIITKTEREIFLQLKSDRERDIFIEAFWKQRDPIPETPENEFKIEHYTRLEYANKRFQFGKPGWMTDRGKIYIILGEPLHIDSYINNKDFRDVEIWFYQNDRLPGLPPAFNIVFYRESEGSDFKLYSPLNDGPQTLLFGHKDYYTGYQEAYEKLQEINPTVAQVSISLIPGESFTPSGTPSMSSEILIANVQSYPQKLISDKYAKEFLKYKDMVEVEYSTNYVESSYILTTIKKDGVYYVHYLIRPKKFTFHRYDDKIVARVILNGIISDAKNVTIYQFEKEFSFNFNEQKIKEIGNRPVIISDLFPIIPGNFKFNLIMKNIISKEFSSFETDILIPERIPSPRLNSFLIFYAVKPDSSERKILRPFQWKDLIFLPETEDSFGHFESAGVFLQFSGLEKERGYRVFISIFDNEKLVKELVRDLKVVKDEEVSLKEEILLSDLPPSLYKLKVTLVDISGKEIISESKSLQLNHLPAIPRPLFYYKLFSVENSLVKYILGEQFYNKGDYKNALNMLKTAYDKNSQNEDFASSFAKVLKKFGRYDDIISILSPFSQMEIAKYETYLLLGEAYEKTGKIEPAIKAYTSALSHYGQNIDLLNSLGECHWQLKDYKSAKFYWSKSLELNPEQSEIKKKLSEIE